MRPEDFERMAEERQRQRAGRVAEAASTVAAILTPSLPPKCEESDATVPGKATVKINIDLILYNEAKAASNTEGRTIAGQIEFWANIGRAIIESPNRPLSSILDSLEAHETPLDEPMDSDVALEPRVEPV